MSVYNTLDVTLRVARLVCDSYGSVHTTHVHGP